ncbi:GSCOCG00004255001-RA-CDS [Cotesia congregata]|uniref:Uricase n=1 Tax=Cotesia congregata TaxID=51543 RepID=A0A8J2HSG7_COTCN|nr:GSCOCG00004255001-RA-CDS [Cotesia congregata]CAG5109034.1 Similar to Uro: Uricase (Drosophila pseudoobscura pseudoobscura) [Cotesia congregata]
MSKLGALADDSLSIMDGIKIYSNPVSKKKVIDSNKIKNNSNAWAGVQLNPVSKHDDNLDKYEIGAYGYGKNNVKLLYVKRENAYRHEIREYEVDTHLRLGSQKDYLEGDNRDIIATDSQKNTVYILAKKYGIKSPEEFGILLCAHYLYTYKHVEEVHVNIEEYPWMRHAVNGVPHNHAFIFNPLATRYCHVTQLRNESPRIRGGLKDMRVLKTTQSSFIDFIQDDYRTLPDANDRIFSTVVTASWDFSTAIDVNFDSVWTTVKDSILEKFAGPPLTGISSPSVQNTLYLAERSILDKVDQIKSIEMRMPNKHYFDLDMSKFPKLVDGENKEVYLPVDKPSGIIYAQLNRKDLTSRL